MVKKILTLIFLTLTIYSNAQGYTKIYIPVGASVQIDDGTTVSPAKNVPCELYLPRVTTDSMALLMALCGTPQNTFTIADNFGPGAWLTSNPHCYDSITSPFDGHYYRFVTLVNCWDSVNHQPIEPQYMGQIIRYMQAHYKIFKRRVYFTGFSEGGTNVTQMASLRDSCASFVQAYVPQSAYNSWEIGDSATFFIYNSISHTFRFDRGTPLGFPATHDLFTKYTNGMWWQHGNTDNIYNITDATAYRDSMWHYFTAHTNFNLTTGAWGHGNWNVMWDPVVPVDLTQSPYTVVQWILQFGSGTGGTATATPVYLPIILSQKQWYSKPYLAKLYNPSP